MHISGVDLDAHVAVVHLEEVEGPLSGADVALARERGDSDGVSLLEQRHVVAEGSVDVVLQGKKDSAYTRGLYGKELPLRDCM